MRKSLFILLMFLLSLPTFALPVPADDLIKELLTKNAQFSQLVDGIRGQPGGRPWDGHFDSMSVDLMESSVVREICNEWSRSASILKVEFRKNGKSVSTHYFATPESAEDLRLCI